MSHFMYATKQDYSILTPGCRTRGSRGSFSSQPFLSPTRSIGLLPVKRPCSDLIHGLPAAFSLSFQANMVLNKPFSDLSTMFFLTDGTKTLKINNLVPLKSIRVGVAIEN